MTIKLQFAITGVTGLLGRNLLLEIIKQNRRNLSEIGFVFFGRSSKNKSLKIRILEILEEELVDYIDDKSFDLNSIYPWLEDNVLTINYSLEFPNLGISQDDLVSLKKLKINFFFHMAALTDFQSSPQICDLLDKINVIGTKNILALISYLNVKEFCFVSSAYVCGMTHGLIAPDYVNLSQNFRNHYEKTKLQAEILARESCLNNGIKFRIFRPSTICGRLIEKTYGSTPKFNVFYGWAVFFLRYKQKILRGENIIESPIEIDFRFCASRNSGLNIVPADFAAKVMYLASIANHDDANCHLVNKIETPHEFYFFEMLKFININGVRMVDEIPSDLNDLEKFYFKTVGKIYTPYIKSDTIDFDQKNISDLLRQNELSCPEINEENFKKLMTFAGRKKFGIEYKKNIN